MMTVPIQSRTTETHGVWSNHTDMSLISIQMRFEEQKEKMTQMENSNERYLSICWELPPKKRKMLLGKFPRVHQQVKGESLAKELQNTKVDPIRSYQLMTHQPLQAAGEFRPESSPGCLIECEMSLLVWNLSKNDPWMKKKRIPCVGPGFFRFL